MRVYIFCTIVVLLAVNSASATIINIPADYPTIQQGINASFDGDTVLVQPGTYIENINFNGHNIVLGSLYLTTGNLDFRFSTIIDGNASGPVVDFVNGENSTASIFGFTIRNGLAVNGGGIHCNYSSPSIRENVISANTVTNHGAGISCSSSYSVIADNIIENNIAIPPMDGGSHGGGIYSGYAETTILRNIIRGNISGPSSLNVASGGGISCYLSNSYIYGNIIKENIASLTGGGIDCGFSSPTIENNLIIGNQCGYSPTNTHGGAIDCGVSFVIIRNNTIYGNTATGVGGAVFFSGNDSLLITNNICWNNTAPADPELHIYGGNPTITYNDIQGGWLGIGNIDIDPLFRDTANGDFHLMATYCGDPYDSPCIDAGDPNIFDDFINCDFGLGGQRSDMGAYGGGDSLIIGILEFRSFLPEGFMLLQNYPNPFNATTTIEYSLTQKSEISLSIYNLLGQRIETLYEGVQAAGEYAVTWEASRLPSGIYFARLETRCRSENIKMLLLK